MNKQIKEISNDLLIYLSKRGIRVDVDMATRIEASISIAWADGQASLLRNELSALHEEV